MATTHPDERLDYWAANTWIWGSPAPYLVDYADWLREGDPDRWHDAALHWNWDYGSTPLWWIASQPRCDAATALTIFFMGQPFDQPDGTEDGALLEMIRKRWSGCGYTSDGIRFDLHYYIDPDANSDFDRVPRSMRCSLPGRIISDTVEWDEAVPYHFIAKYRGVPS